MRHVLQGCTGLKGQIVNNVLEFRAPARVDEIVEARIRVARIGNSSIVMELELWRPDPALLLTTIEAVYAGYDAAAGASRPVPDELRQLISRYEDTGEILPLSDFPALAAAMADAPSGSAGAE